MSYWSSFLGPSSWYCNEWSLYSPFLSGLVHFWTKAEPSLKNSTGTSVNFSKPSPAILIYLFVVLVKVLRCCIFIIQQRLFFSSTCSPVIPSRCLDVKWIRDHFCFGVFYPQFDPIRESIDLNISEESFLVLNQLTEFHSRNW